MQTEIRREIQERGTGKKKTGTGVNQVDIERVVATAEIEQGAEAQKGHMEDMVAEAQIEYMEDMVAWTTIAEAQATQGEPRKNATEEKITLIGIAISGWNLPEKEGKRTGDTTETVEDK